MAKNGWIDVSEQLPEIKKKVMIWCDSIGFTYGFYWGIENTKENEPCKGWSIMGVTHWQEIIDGPY
jgi:hypothetical protein